jgi:cytochrome d ubiquinol oxidase subunit II
MSVAITVAGIMFLGVMAYAVFAGADFGSGVWDLTAGDAERGAPMRSLIDDSIGPVWEANHVWLIFVLVYMWTGFPHAFSALSDTLFIPLTLAAFGIVLRGSAFAFRKSVPEVSLKRLFGATFAASSVITPFFLGTVAGAVASGRVPPGNARGDAVTSWLNPTSVLGGTMAVGVCAYLAAVYLCADSRRDGHDDLAEAFRLRAIVTAMVVGLIALAGIAVLAVDAPKLFDGLTGRALPLMAVSGVAGVGSLVLLVRRDYTSARITSAAAVTSVIWGWGVAQYPYLLEPSFTVDEAAANGAALRPLLVTMVVAAGLVGPSLVLLIGMFQRTERGNTGSREDA